MPRLLCILALLLAAIGVGPAIAASRGYPASDAPLVDPERGFWSFLADDFLTVTTGDLKAVRAEGVTVGYAVVRLDRWRDRPLPPTVQLKLAESLAAARKAGIKVILRFAYNYPQDEHEYEKAEDAPLSVVRQHILQLMPVVASNRDVILVMQAGFIGAWGEGHSSSNGLDRPGPKREIRDMLLAALPRDRQLQWRYPADVIAWLPDVPGAAEARRIGIHNDCFLSSPTDVGTYSGRPARRAAQRAYVAALSRRTIFGGETCAANPDRIRASCADILREGPQFHLVTLNRDYYRRFMRQWQAEGCFDEVSRKMGHRLRLVSATAPDAAARGTTALVAVTVANDGWARVHNPRRLTVVAVHRASGRSYAIDAGSLEAVEPEDTAADGFTARWAIPATAPAGPYDLFVAAPDKAPRLADDPRFALRFANAAGSGYGFVAATGRFRLGLTITVN